MFELYREKTDGAEPSEGETDAATETGKWRWQLTQGDKVIATSDESWTKRSAAKAAVDKVKALVAHAPVIEKLG